MTDVTFTPAQPSAPVVHDAPTVQRSPQPAAPVAAPVGPPQPTSSFPIDEESGAPYRPWTIGGVTVRCAVEVPIGLMAELAQLQAALPSKPLAELTPQEQAQPLLLIDRMWQMVVWEEDFAIVRARLSDKKRPIGRDEFERALKDLFDHYRGGVGNGQ